jgi:alkylation response protein AidB-like acyl-CoA dehydrogenase
MTFDQTDRERKLRQQARSFGEEQIKPVAMEYVKSGEWPWEVLKAAADEGLIGLPFEPAYGGADATVVEECLVIEELCRADSSVGMALHGSMTGCTVVSEFGTHDQKKRWLEPVTGGEITTGIGLTEPDTGSDLAQASTSAERDGNEYVINGSKKWIANGRSGEWVATLCVTDPGAESRHRGLTLIVVPTDADGYKAETLDKLGLDATEHARIDYNGVRVPVENRLGEEENQGFYQSLAWLKEGRVTISAAHLGMALGALDRALDYAKSREQKDQRIGDFQGMRWKLADMRTKIEVARSHTYRIARLIDRAEDGEDVSENLIEQASIAKVFATEAAIDVAEEAIQVFGGNGYEKESEVEHIWRDAKAGTIYEGTSEVQRNTIGKALFDEL